MQCIVWTYTNADKTVTGSEDDTIEEIENVAKQQDKSEMNRIGSLVHYLKTISFSPGVPLTNLS